MSVRFFAAGAGDNTTGATLSPGIPNGVIKDDIAICHAMIREATDRDIAFPGDWNEVSDVVAGGVNSAWAWKRLTGSEGGTTISVTGAPGGGIGFVGRIYVFRGCVPSGTPFEAATTTNGTGTTYSSSAITTLGPDRLAICLTVISDDDKAPLTNMTGSNVRWTKTVAEFASASGLDETIICEQAEVGPARLITAGSQAYSGSEDWRTHTFALIAPEPTFLGSGRYKTPGQPHETLRRRKPFPAYSQEPGAVIEIPTFGGAIAGGTAPLAVVATTAAGATGQGNPPVPGAVLTAQGATAGGTGATSSSSATPGGATAQGTTGPAAVVSVPVEPEVSFQITTADDDDSGYWQDNDPATWPPDVGGFWEDDLGTDLQEFVSKGRNIVISTYYYAGNAFFRWDTSALPDDATILSATLRLPLQSVFNTGGAGEELVGDYYDFGGAPTVAADGEPQISPSIFTALLLSGLNDFAWLDVPLTDLTGISKSGYTGIRLGIEGTVAPDDGDDFGILLTSFEARQHPTNPDSPRGAAELVITYSLPLPTAGGFGPTAVVTLTSQGATSGGNAPGVPVYETATFGGAVASGNSPLPTVAVTAAGASAAGTSPVAIVGVTAGGATGQGNSPAVSESVTPGGAIAQGTGGTASVPPTPGGADGTGSGPLPTVILTSQGATAGGNPPTVDEGVTETPDFGGATAGGVSPVAVVGVDFAGSTGQGNQPGTAETAGSGGALAQGNGATAVVGVTPGGATSGGNEPSAPLSETPTFGGATASGTAPGASVTSATGGASANGSGPSPSSTPTPGGATANGNDTSSSSEVSVGGSVAGGNASTPAAAVDFGGSSTGSGSTSAIVGVDPGGAISGGNPPSAPLTEQPIFGGATAGGNDATSAAGVDQGGNSTGGGTTTAYVSVTPGGAIGAGRPPTEIGVTPPTPAGPTPGSGVSKRVKIHRDHIEYLDEPLTEEEEEALLLISLSLE